MGVLTYILFLKPLSNIRDDKKWIMFLDFFKPSLGQKGMFWISEFCLAFCFRLDALRYKRREHLYFPNWGWEKQAVDPSWAQLPSPFLARVLLWELVIASITLWQLMFHRDCPGHSPPAATTLLCKHTSPRALTRGRIFSLKVSETSLVQFRGNTYDLAYIKGYWHNVLQSVSHINSGVHWGQDLGWISLSAPFLCQQ